MKKTILKSLFIIHYSLFIIHSSFAQISYGGTPYSFHSQFSILNSQFSIDSVPRIIMPKINVSLLLKEDSIESSGKLVPWRFAKAIDVNLNLNNSGFWQTLPNGDRLWRLSIKSEHAFSLSFFFSKFKLAAGSKLFIYSKDKKVVLGAFTEKNNRDNGIFSTTIVKGDEAVLEFYEPVDMIGKSIIQLSKVTHAYKNIFSYPNLTNRQINKSTNQHNELKDFGDAGSCNINVNCPVGLPWSDEKRAVAMILEDYGERICSGSLLNDVREDGIPYFLTANHCIGSDTVSRWVFMFNYESPNCNNIDGPTNYTISGSTLIATDTPSDFLLLRLDDIPPADYNVFYEGWSAVDTTADSCVVIHHPSGDIKKISFEYKYLLSTDWYSGVPDSHWTVPEYVKGTTEPGSSGCPLFNKYHRVIGQLNGGAASCSDQDSTDNYGKFSYSWNMGSSPAHRLKDWLDPDNTGTLIITGKNSNVSILPIQPVNEVFLVYPNPNPADNPLYINYVSARNQSAECTIYNMLGQAITNFSIENNNTKLIHFNNLRKGLYFLSLTDYHGTRVKKLIIM